MTGLDARRKGMDAKLHHDDELRFLIHTRRDRLFGEWAAMQLGLSGERAHDYAHHVVTADLEEPGDDDMLRKVMRDFTLADLPFTHDETRAQLARLHDTAKHQVFEEA